MRIRLCMVLLLAVFIQPLQAQSTHPEKPGKAAVATAHYMATEAGHETFAMGGNAFDAAVAISAVLAVLEQTSCGIGGGGFYMIHRAEDGYETMIDAREVAPALAHKDMYLNPDGTANHDLSRSGPLAAGIPGVPAALAHIAEHYGRLPLSAAAACAGPSATPETSAPAWRTLRRWSPRRGSRPS